MIITYNALHLLCSEALLFCLLGLLLYKHFLTNMGETISHMKCKGPSSSMKNIGLDMNDVWRSTNVRSLLELTIRDEWCQEEHQCTLSSKVNHQSRYTFLFVIHLYRSQLYSNYQPFQLAIIFNYAKWVSEFFLLRIIFCGYGIIKKAKKGNYTNGLITIFLDNCINIAQVVLFLLVQ